MCVLAFAWQHHPRWRLVLAGNRDEAHDRPAEPLKPWTDALDVLAGRDLRSGGTWLGVSTQGRMAVVTNMRGQGAPDPAAPSRGLLVADLLKGQGPYAAPEPAGLAAFAPFNLITVRNGRAEVMGNRPEPFIRALVPGLYGLSNGAFDEPWLKSERLKAAVGLWMMADREPDHLLNALADESRPDDGPPQSAIFIRDARYGTRCSTVVAITPQGAGIVFERRFDAAGTMTGETRLAFTWP